MKPALIRFALTAALLSLNVLPSVWSAAPQAGAASFETHPPPRTRRKWRPGWV